MQIDEGGFFSRGKVRLPPSPDLTVDAVYSEILDNFATARQYEVYKTALIGADLVIKRSGWTGLAIKVKHSANETLIMFNPLAPSVMVRLLFMGLLPMLILYFGAWSEIRREFIEYAKSAVRFQR